MIIVYVMTNEPEQVKEIVELLINEKLITGVTVMDTVSSYKNDNDEIETVSTNLLIGRTKAMLFTTIEKLLKFKYGDKMPVLYAVPVVNMDVAHMEKLKKVIKEV